MQHQPTVEQHDGPQLVRVSIDPLQLLVGPLNTEHQLQQLLADFQQRLLVEF
jgi:hypothetical protein